MCIYIYIYIHIPKCGPLRATGGSLGGSLLVPPWPGRTLALGRLRSESNCNGLGPECKCNRLGSDWNCNRGGRTGIATVWGWLGIAADRGWIGIGIEWDWTRIAVDWDWESFGIGLQSIRIGLGLESIGVGFVFCCCTPRASILLPKCGPLLDTRWFPRGSLVVPLGASSPVDRRLKISIHMVL